VRIFSAPQATSNKAPSMPLVLQITTKPLIISITVLTVLPRNKKKDAVNDNAVKDYRNIQ